jgi:hypothetical protein
MTTIFTYVLAYLIACVVGNFVVALLMYGMRWLVLRGKSRAPFFDWANFFFGATERAVALTLVLLAPPYLPAFIGGWVLLKFAIGWQREKHSNEVATQSFGVDWQRPFVRNCYRGRCVS